MKLGGMLAFGRPKDESSAFCDPFLRTAHGLLHGEIGRPEPMQTPFDEAGHGICDSDGDKGQTEKNHKHQNQVEGGRYYKINHDRSFLFNGSCP